jgi:hypothetical protein
MGDGRIFQKNRRASTFNKDLSNEPYISLIRLSGYYTYYHKLAKGATQERVYVGSKYLITTVTKEY